MKSAAVFFFFAWLAMLGMWGVSEYQLSRVNKAFKSYNDSITERIKKFDTICNLKCKKSFLEGQLYQIKRDDSLYISNK